MVINKILERRKFLHLSQLTVAYRSGLSLTHYRLCEQVHGRGLSAEAKVRIAETLGVKPEEIFEPGAADGSAKKTLASDL